MISPAGNQNYNHDSSGESIAEKLRGLESENRQGPDALIYFASFLGDNAFEFYRQIVAYLANVTGIPAELVSGLSPLEQDQLVNQGQIQAVFTCGLPYVHKAHCQPPLLRLIAAPVMLGARYCDRPIYFSDVIVQADSPYQTFEDLRGTTFAYNEVYSLSGYMLPCYHLLSLGEMSRFFCKTVRSGSHAVSMDWVESGRAAAAAIDSIVLEMELAQHPERAWTLRVIENMGPATMPPVAASIGLPDDLRRQLRQALLEMPTTDAGRAILSRGEVRRFAVVTDNDYDVIRRMIRALQEVGIAELR
jgi:phosphonate transport system substrate-binding protein